MFIGEGQSLETRRAAQAERRAANTATATVASSASLPFFALSPPVEMESIASLPTPVSAN